MSPILIHSPVLAPFSLRSSGAALRGRENGARTGLWISMGDMMSKAKMKIYRPDKIHTLHPGIGLHFAKLVLQI